MDLTVPVNKVEFKDNENTSILVDDQTKETTEPQKLALKDKNHTSYVEFRQKNNVSARKSRMRRKMYDQMMTKQTDMQRVIHAQNKHIDGFRMHFLRLQRLNRTLLFQVNYLKHIIVAMKEENKARKQKEEKGCKQQISQDQFYREHVTCNIDTAHDSNVVDNGYYADDHVIMDMASPPSLTVRSCEQMDQTVVISPAMPLKLRMKTRHHSIHD